MGVLKGMATHCTDSVNYQKFRPHGRVELSVIDNKIVTFKALGPFNVELVATLREIESEVLKELNKNWVEVVIFEHSCLAPKEVFIEFTSHLKAQKASGITPLASAYVFSKEVDGLLLMTNEYKKCFDDAGLLYKQFDSESEALSWVKTFV
ncbi:MAG: hypothetical protein GY951_01060 [Psychromonas sp.]|nr:hypothetical protein [Alteromonadales bacterium]MCP5076639.1 hypothetical protein [Psychromonas sp.]